MQFKIDASYRSRYQLNKKQAKNNKIIKIFKSMKI